MRCIAPRHFLLAWLSFFVPLLVLCFRRDEGIGIAIASIAFAAACAAGVTIVLHGWVVRTLAGKQP